MACENFCHSIDRDHKVEISKDFVPDVRAGKGGACVLTERADCGPGGTPSPINADSPVKSYTSKADMAMEWDASCPAYVDACALFNQTPRPPEVTIAFYDGANPSTSNAVTEILGCLVGCYAISMPDLKDDPRIIDAAILFNGTPQHQLNINTSDPAVLDPTDPMHMASVGYILSQLALDVNVNYQDETTLSGTNESLAAAVSGIQATQQFDTGSGYDLFYQQPNGISPAQITPGQANTLDDLRINYVVCQSSGDGARVNVYKTGILQSGIWADSRHKCCALQARMSEAQFADSVANGPPLFDEECYINKIDVYSETLSDWADRKLITGDRSSDDDFRRNGYLIQFPEYANIPDGDFASRMLPCGFGVTFDSGRIHTTCFNFAVRT